MRKTSEEESTLYKQNGMGGEEWQEWSPTASSSYNESEGVHGGSETSNVVRVGDGGTAEKAGGGDGGGRVEDVTILVIGVT